MFFEWYHTAALAIVMLAYSLWQIWRMEMERLNKSIQTRMEEYAKEAVRKAKSDFRIELDYTIDSVENVNSILNQIHDTNSAAPAEPKQLSKTVLLWGSYVGITLQKKYGGEWKADSKEAGSNTYPLCFANGFEAIPIKWCLRHIRQGPADPIIDKFNTAVRTLSELSTNVEGNDSDQAS